MGMSLMKSKLELPLNEARVLLAIVNSIQLDYPDSSLQTQQYRKYCNNHELIPNKAKMHCLLNVIADLQDRGWQFYFDEDERAWFAKLNKLISKENHADEIKKRMRNQLLIGVKENFLQQSTQDFIARMEDTNKRQLSISNLIDCPRELIDSLNNLDCGTDDFTKQVIDPYVQEADKTRDHFTNLRLTDIWRYFRLTWSLPFRSNPGRSQPFLIRNKARKNHPVIGIAMLASPVLGLKPRDKELCLIYEDFLNWATMKKISMKELINMIKDEIRAALINLDYKKFISSKELRSPNGYLIEELARKIRALGYKQKALGNTNLNENEKDNIMFESKKLIRLKQLMERRIEIKKLEKDIKRFNLTIEKCKNNENFKAIVQAFLNATRTKIMSTDCMDLSVCGSIAPYNELIGGKLIGLLIASNEVSDMFDKKYGKSSSEIAKKIAGRNIRKKSNLKCITTSSLYGVHSSQYNRLKIKIGTNQEIYFKKLKDHSEGFGTFQFSDHTQKLITEYYEKFKTKTVDYKFGQGTSPRLRRLRQATRELGFIGTHIFRHQQERIVYFLDLYNTSADQIFKKYKRKQKRNTASASKIAKAWRQRWLENRIKKPKIYESLSKSSKKDYLLSKKLKDFQNGRI